MGEQLYGLTARTADQVRVLLADGGAVGGRASSAPQARGVTWVEVTGEADEDGWHPGTAYTTAGAGWVAGTVGVLVAAPDGAELSEGVKYLSTRTGDTTDGVARFRAILGASVSHASVGASGGITAGSSWLPYSPGVTVPSAGTYLLWATASASTRHTKNVNDAFAPAGLQAYVQFRLNDETAGAVVPNTTRMIANQQGYTTIFDADVTGGVVLCDLQASATIITVVEVEAPTEFKIHVRGLAAGTAEIATFFDPFIGYARLAGGAAGTVGGFTGTIGG